MFSRKKEQGAVDLASIMTGLIVLGLIGGVIAATVFIIIPWAQDQAAKKQVAEIEVAQTTYAAGNADPNNPLYSTLVKAEADPQPVEYAPLGKLVEHGLLSLELDEQLAVNGIITTANNGRICSNTTSEGGYQAAVRSQTGNVFYTTDLEQGVKKAADGLYYCLRDEAVGERDLRSTFTFTIDTSLCTDPKMQFSSIKAGAELIHNDSGTTRPLEKDNSLNKSGSWTIRGELGQFRINPTAAENGCLTSIDEWKTADISVELAEYAAALEEYNIKKSAYDEMSAIWSAEYQEFNDQLAVHIAEITVSPEYTQIIQDLTDGVIDGLEANTRLYDFIEERYGLVMPTPPSLEYPTRPTAPRVQSTIHLGRAFLNAKNLETVNAAPPFIITNAIEMFKGAEKLTTVKGDWVFGNNAKIHSMFYDAFVFNSDISHWDVSNVTDMHSMFLRAKAFNQPIGNWDVSNVTNMAGMFQEAVSFDQPLNDWDVSQVTTFRSLFEGATVFNQPLDNWDVSNATNLNAMFRSTKAFNQNINNWQTGKVTSLYNTFSFTEMFDQPLNNWDVSNVTDMNGTFNRALKFNQPLDKWVTSNVTTMGSMFSGHTLYVGEYESPVFNQDISMWDTSNVTQMWSIFRGTTVFNQPLNSWDVSKVESFQYAFDGAIAFNQPLDEWEPKSATSFMGMFSRTHSFNQPIGNWETGTVTNMKEMFLGAKAFNQPLNDWDVSNVTTLEGTFMASVAFNQPLDKWDTGNVINIIRTFADSVSFYQDISMWNVDKPTAYLSLFASKSKLPNEFLPPKLRF